MVSSTIGEEPSDSNDNTRGVGNLGATTLPKNYSLSVEIPFNKPFLTGKESRYLNQAIAKLEISSDGKNTERCEQILEDEFGIARALFVTSGTSALEMAAMLCAFRPGDEVIMPSYTFVSTANAFVREGATPVFIDIREDTMNLNEKLIEAAITPKTKAIVPVHYAGVSCEMDFIMRLAREHQLLVIEDAAQAVHSTYKSRALGSIGHLGAYSFHETKNYVCGEGGALCVNDRSLIERAEIIREKGTNRKQFMHGVVDKYTWVDKGSSFINSELAAAFLLGQLKALDVIRDRRRERWLRYQQLLTPLASCGFLRLPAIPRDCDPNYHMYQIVLSSETTRNSLMAYLRKKKIYAVFHYIPLHTSPMGTKLGYTRGALPVTEEISKCILRLPLHPSLTINEQEYVVKEIQNFFT